ncbi:MAG: hypothetical protein MHMPM18_005133 [Marteilia pararefringens]
MTIKKFWQKDRKSIMLNIFIQISLNKPFHKSANSIENYLVRIVKNSNIRRNNFNYKDKRNKMVTIVFLYVTKRQQDFYHIKIRADHQFFEKRANTSNKKYYEHTAKFHSYIQDFTYKND